MGQAENVVKNEILEYLRLCKIYAWSNNTGAVSVRSPRGRDRFIRFGKPGSSDILGIMPDGRFIAIECKAERGRLSVMQRDFLEDIRSRGGVAFVARGVEDVERELHAARPRKEA